MKFVCQTLARIALAIASTLSCSALAAAENDGAGLVLAGGGARGIAHVGAITALEEMQIPISGIAGTSMGALVGGLYAIGMDSAQLREVIETISWDEAFEDSLERNDRPQRRKSDDYDYPASVSLAFKDGEISIPLGLVQGQQVRQMIKELVIEAHNIKDFDALPTPYRAVATDIESGDAYIFEDGDIVTAMRASMSLPALLAPVEHDGRLLVDGGLAMNIPVSVGRDMGAPRLIVIDIGTPLRSRNEISSVLGVADQLVGFLTRRNSLEQLATLQDQDILISPELEGIGMLDFEQAETIFQRGYDATMAMRDQLQAHAMDDQQWSAYLAKRSLPAASDPIIDQIEIVNDSPLRDDIIRVRLRQQLGEPLDRQQLLDDIAEIYTLDHWQIIDYEVLRDATGSDVLRISAQAKSWGIDHLKFGVNLVSDLDGSSDINLGTSYLWKGLTDLGGELYGRAQVGDTILFSGEFYQPLDVRSRFFVVPHASYRDYEATTLGPEFSAEDTLGTWRVRRLVTQFEAGMNILDSTQLRMGLFRNKGEYQPDKEAGGSLADDRYDEGGAIFSLRYDSLDNAYFPTRGAFLYGEYSLLRDELGSDNDFERWQGLGQFALSFGHERRNTLIFTGRTGQSLDAPNEPQNYYQLGGLFNLSGLSQNYFSGRQMAFAMAQYQRRLSANTVLPFDMPTYLGASIEGGQLWSDRSDVTSGDFVNAGSIYFAMDSPIGPIYIAYGRSEDAEGALYLALGWPFLNNQMRIGR